MFKPKKKEKKMTLLGNILWFIFGGFLTTIMWLVVGVLQCITIIGIPVGLQSFKMAKLALAPFGKEIIYSGRADKIILNVIWLILGGLVLALYHALLGLTFLVTLIGIPFGLQYLKMAKLALMPFGATVEPKAKKENTVKS